MKLKKTQEPETVAPAPTQGRAAIADRFKLDVEAPKDPNGVGKTAAAIALVGCLLTIALMGVVTWLMYQNWELIQDV